MRRSKLYVIGSLILGLFQTVNLKAIDVVIEMPSGEHFRFDATPQDTLENIISIANAMGSEGESMAYTFSCVPYEEQLLCKAAKVRDYNAPISDATVKDIRFIILTLANQPLLKLKKYKSSLKSAGDRLDNVHPLNIWRIIFTDNEMVSAMYNIKRRSKVWDNFISGMAKSLEEAYEVHDLKSEYIEDFCHKIGIKASLLISYINVRDWEGMIKQILNHISRDGEPHRYDQ